MSDERLREAERKWKETGSVDDEARYLLERVRVGDLTQERLELAAYCGHEAAGRVAPVRGDDKFPTWAKGLARFGKSACVFAAVVIADRAMSRCPEPARSDPRVTSLTSLARGWLNGSVGAVDCATRAQQMRQALVAPSPLRLELSLFSIDGVIAVDTACCAASAAGQPDAELAAAEVYGAALFTGEAGPCTPMFLETRLLASEWALSMR